MKNESDVTAYYKYRRDYFQKNGNQFAEAFYQILLVEEVKKKKTLFHGQSEYRQHKSILSQLLDEALGTDDANFQRGICEEVILAGKGVCLSGEEEEYRMCSRLFARSKKKEYIHGAYQIHINGILAVAQEDKEAAELYAKNLLLLLRLRYGTDSRQYAKMKLHIVGEFHYLCKREIFFHEFKENYEYFKKYTSDYDSFFAETVIFYAYHRKESGDKDYTVWMIRGKEAVEKRKDDKLYGSLKCKLAWLEAKVLSEEQGKNEEALTVLQEAIAKHAEKKLKLPFYGYMYLLTANVCYKLQDFSQMAYYAQKGLEICKELKQEKTELYYNLHNYIGIRYRKEQKWEEAERLYAKDMQDIRKLFGKENENYVIYTGNMIELAICQGKSADVYVNELRSIQSPALRKKYKALFHNELNAVIAGGGSMDEIRAVYKKCLRDIEGEGDTQEKMRLDALYLTAMANEGSWNENFVELLSTF